MRLLLGLLFVVCLVSVVFDATRYFQQPLEVARVVQMLVNGSVHRLITQRFRVSRIVFRWLRTLYQEMDGHTRRKVYKQPARTVM